MNDEEQEVVRSVFDGIEHFTDLHFEEVSKDGMIRTSISEMDMSMVGYAFFPVEAWDLGGDVFLS